MCRCDEMKRGGGSDFGWKMSSSEERPPEELDLRTTPCTVPALREPVDSGVHHDAMFLVSLTSHNRGGTFVQAFGSSDGCDLVAAIVCRGLSLPLKGLMASPKQPADCSPWMSACRCSRKREKQTQKQDQDPLSLPIRLSCLSCLSQ